MTERTRRKSDAGIGQKARGELDGDDRSRADPRGRDQGIGASLLFTYSSASIMARVKTLRFEAQSQLLTKVAQLADQCGWYSGALQAAGYRSFLAGQEFDRSFCEAGELEEHKRCQIEIMKKLIETPDGILLRRSDRESKIEADPCLRRLRRMELEDRINVEKRRSEMYAKLMGYRAEELSRHTDHNFELARENYASYFGSILANVFRSVEFQPDAFRSAPEFPVISKPLNPDWDICWSRVEQNASLAATGTVG